MKNAFRRRGRTARWVLVLLSVLLLVAAVAVLWPRTRSGVPQPSQRDAATMKLPPQGTTITIKQRNHAWLPGGKLQLHLDDITAGQVLVSVTNSKGAVVFGSRSIREGDAFNVYGLNVKAVRLKNLLTGDDFAEFMVTPQEAERP